MPCTTVRANPDVWVSDRIDALLRTARAAYDEDKAVPRYNRTLDGITATLKQCKLSTDTDFANRYRNFVEYIATISLDRNPDHELGFAVPDRQYFAETRTFVGIPEFLQDQQFLKLVSRTETLDRAKAFLKQLNEKRQPAEKLIYFSYKSRHLGTPDNDFSYRRLLIVVPGDVAKGIPEKWVQFGVTDPGRRVRIRNLSVVSAVQAPDGKFDTYFKDYFRTYPRSGPVTINGRWDLGYGDDNCTKCHKSGILPIFPVAGSVSAEELPAMATVNKRFLTYGSPRFGGYLDLKKLGPGLSTATNESRRQRFGTAFEGTAVAKAMTCVACHQPDRFGSFAWPMDDTLIGSYVTGGQMPFGYQLTVSERIDLYDKLVEEYFATDKARPGILKTWLLSRAQ